MGIHGLMGLLNDEAPGSVKEQDIKAFTGRKVAIDASMAMYQFLVAVRSAEHATGAASMLTNEAGEVTSHIQGLFNRTIRMMTNGIKPVYVFDGKPPTLKGGELAKRTKGRAKAAADLKAAEERDDMDAVNKYSSRLVKVTRQHNEDAKTLLRLMGVPVVEAPGEAEAQCAVLAKAGAVFATGTEDMDALTFATPYLLKKLTFSASSGGASGGAQNMIQQICYDKMLEGLELSHEQFVDLCIMCGCDYCDKIPGIGPKTALKLVKKHGSLDEIVKHLDVAKHPLPPGFEHPATRRERRAKEKAADAKAGKVKFNSQQPQEEPSSSSSSSSSSAAPAAATSSAEPSSVASSSSATATAAAAAETAPVAHVSSASQDENPLVDSDDESLLPSTKKALASAAGPVVASATTSNAIEAASSVVQSAEEIAAMEEATAAAEVAAAKAALAEEDDDDDEIDEEAEAAWEPLWVQVRQLFVKPDATPADSLQEVLKWTEPNEPELLKFLVERMQFNEERVLGGLKRLKAARGSSSQQRMDSFFKVSGTSSSTNKRKVEEPKTAKSKKGKILTKAAASKGKK